jgi:hypothetical protein
VSPVAPPGQEDLVTISYLWRLPLLYRYRHRATLNEHGGFERELSGGRGLWRADSVWSAIHNPQPPCHVPSISPPWSTPGSPSSRRSPPSVRGRA